MQIRRAETTGRKEEEHRFTYQELELNKGDFTVKVGNTELPHITKQEFSILELLLKHPKKVFSKEEMFEYAWEEQYMGETKTLDVHISNIRKKIKNILKLYGGSGTGFIRNLYSFFTFYLRLISNLFIE